MHRPALMPKPFAPRFSMRSDEIFVVTWCIFPARLPLDGPTHGRSTGTSGEGSGFNVTTTVDAMKTDAITADAIQTDATRTDATRTDAIKVVLAQPRGFCAGVVRAIEIVERALEKYGPPVYVRHEIVHN